MKGIYLSWLLLLGFMFGYAQLRDSLLGSGSNDSALSQIQSLLMESEQARMRDSIRSAVLLEELSTFKNPQVSKARELQAELEMVRNQDSLRLIQQRQTIELFRTNIQPVAVILFYDTLFKIYAPLGSFIATQRAFNAEEHIVKTL